MKYLKYIVIIALIGGLIGWFWYKSASKHPDALSSKDKVVIEAEAFYTLYSDNESLADSMYLEKVISVKGEVKSVSENETDGIKRFTVNLNSGKDIGLISCEMDTTQNAGMIKVTAGSKVEIAGFCNGKLFDDVLLDRCKLAQ